jgi:hypothetical protein
MPLQVGRRFINASYSPRQIPGDSLILRGLCQENDTCFGTAVVSEGVALISPMIL